MKYALLSFAALAALFVMIISPIIVHHTVAFAKDVTQAFKNAPSVGGKFKQAGLVTLLRAYGGYSQGQTVGFNASTETSLIASGQAVNGTTVTPGALSCQQQNGVCAVAAGAGSVVITNPLITPQSRVWAVISQVAADATATHVTRVVAAIGSVTIFVNANATAQTQIDWAIGYSNSQVNPS